jgi:hypothetical protein
MTEIISPKNNMENTRSTKSTENTTEKTFQVKVRIWVLASHVGWILHTPPLRLEKQPDGAECLDSTGKTPDRNCSSTTSLFWVEELHDSARWSFSHRDLNLVVRKGHHPSGMVPLSRFGLIFPLPWSGRSRKRRYGFVLLLELQMDVTTSYTNQRTAN